MKLIFNALSPGDHGLSTIIFLCRTGWEKAKTLGRFLTDAMVKFDPMRNTFTDIWHPLRGLILKNLGEAGTCLEFSMKLTSNALSPGDYELSTIIFLYRTSWEKAKTFEKLIYINVYSGCKFTCSSWAISHNKWRVNLASSWVVLLSAIENTMVVVGICSWG